MDLTWGAWAAGAVLVAVELGRSIPAWRRVRQFRSSDAVSPESIAILAGFGTGWVLLAFLLGAWPVLIATVLWLILHLLICREVWSVSPGKRRRMLWTFTGSALTFAAATAALTPALGVTAALGIVLGVATVLDSIPALVEGLAAATTRGLSVTALSVNTGEGAIYLALGLGWVAASADPDADLIGYLVYGAVALAANVPRLIRVVHRRRRGLS